MLENLFSSQIIFKLLSLMFSREGQELSTSELIELTGKKQTNIMRELEKLANWQMVTKTKKGKQNFYKLNHNYAFYDQLKALFIKYGTANKKYLVYTEEANAALLTLNYFSIAYANSMAVKLGILSQMPDLLSYYKNNYVRFYFEKDVVEKITAESLKKLLADSSFVQDIIYVKSTAKGEEALSNFKHLQAKNYKVKPEEALKLLDQFTDIISTQISLNCIAILDLFNEPYSNYLKTYLQKQLKDTDLRLNYVLEKLLAPEHLTWTQLYRREMINLVLQYKSEKINYKPALKAIYENWKWLNFNYRGPEYTLEYFEQIFNEMINKELQELESELDYIDNNDKYALKEKNKIFKELKIDQKHQDYINALSILSYLKVYRKDTAFLLVFLTHKIMEQFAGELKKENWLYLTQEEARDLIKGKLKVTKAQLVEREKECAYLGQEKILLVGHAAAKFVSENTIADEFSLAGGLKLLEGTTACLGKTGDWVYGKVKIINQPEDMSKMEYGDILVSYATVPDILPAMKKAGAIVTDQGGITSHAAIVSRELNIPCVIGTKYATKIFKDGDRVIVCPRHGHIRFQ
ncbi:MAG: PEP-utilizing enzyme [Candidatus Parcubacteria bacterium]|nr:PEP-utilizing enzyme [Candidatus Parcubacteria bacterium]